jgi:hypothetical protein
LHAFCSFFFISQIDLPFCIFSFFSLFFFLLSQLDLWAYTLSEPLIFKGPLKVAYKYGSFPHYVNPSLPLLIFDAPLSSSPDWLGFLCACPVIHQKISMADTRVVDLDAGVVVEKRGRGRPRGSKNKPKVVSMAASSSAPAKQRPGHPLGSKNKSKSSTSQVNEPLDISAAHLDPPPPSTRTVFSFLHLLVPNVVSNNACL